MAKNNISPTIFREYDIRGRVDIENELSDRMLYLLGRGTGTFFHARGIKRAVVGHDARSYAPHVKDSIVQGLLESGIDVIEMGQILTPIFYFSQYYLKEKAGIMVTASHNPNGWSGMKIAHDFSTTLLPHEIQELRHIVEEEDFISGSGTRSNRSDIIEAYIQDIAPRFTFKKKFRILIDAGNGTAGATVPELFRRVGCEVVERHCDIDTTYPHHIPNPSNLEAAYDIARGTKEAGADIGFGFDDDGDRLGFADEKGTVVWPDKVFALLTREILEKEPGASIVFDVKTSLSFIEDIEAHGGKPVMCKTGHSYIKQKAKEEDAPFAGERSGHIFFRRGYYGFDDAMYGALKVLETLERGGVSFSEMLSTVPHYFTSPAWAVDCEDDKKYRVVDELVALFKEEYGDARVIDINGARVIFEGGWGLVRASSNLPTLVLLFESKTEHGLEEIEKIFKEKLALFPEVGMEWHSG